MLAHHNYTTLKPAINNMGAGDQQLPLQAQSINKIHRTVRDGICLTCIFFLCHYLHYASMLQQVK